MIISSSTSSPRLFGDGGPPTSKYGFDQFSCFLSFRQFQISFFDTRFTFLKSHHIIMFIHGLCLFISLITISSVYLSISSLMFGFKRKISFIQLFRSSKGKYIIRIGICIMQIMNLNETRLKVQLKNAFYPVLIINV